MNPPVMAVPAPLRAGHAPQMGLREKEGKLPEVDIKGDADSLKVVENYLDDEFSGAEPKIPKYARP